MAVAHGDRPELPSLTPTSIPQRWFMAAAGLMLWDEDEAASILLAHARHFRAAEMTHC